MDVTQTLAKPPLNTWERNGNTTHRTSYQDISSNRSNIPNQTFQFSSSKIARHRTIESLRMTGVGTPMTPWRVPIGWEIKMPSNTCADWLQRSPGVLEDLERPWKTWEWTKNGAIFHGKMRVVLVIPSLGNLLLHILRTACPFWGDCKSPIFRHKHIMGMDGYESKFGTPLFSMIPLFFQHNSFRMTSVVYLTHTQPGHFGAGVFWSALLANPRGRSSRVLKEGSSCWSMIHNCLVVLHDIDMTWYDIEIYIYIE